MVICQKLYLSFQRYFRIGMRCYSCSAFPGATGARCPGEMFDVDEGFSCTVRALSDSTVVYQVQGGPLKFHKKLWKVLHSLL